MCLFCLSIGQKNISLSLLSLVCKSDSLGWRKGKCGAEWQKDLFKTMKCLPSPGRFWHFARMKAGSEGHGCQDETKQRQNCISLSNRVWLLCQMGNHYHRKKKRIIQGTDKIFLGLFYLLWFSYAWNITHTNTAV